MHHLHEKPTEIEQSSPFTCVLAGVPGHAEQGQMAIRPLDALQKCLLKRWYGVKKIEPIYDVHGFNGFILIIFGDCDEASYDAFKLQARFQSHGQGRVDWFSCDDAMQPCLWVMDFSDRNMFWQAAMTARVASVVKERAYTRIEREDDGVYEAITEALAGMYPTSIECAYPYTCALTCGPGGPSRTKNVKLCSDLIQESLMSMGYLVESVDAKYEEHDFEGVFLIRLGYSDEACFSAFKLEAQFQKNALCNPQATTLEHTNAPRLWMSTRKDYLLFDRKMSAVYVPQELIDRAQACGHAADKNSGQQLLAKLAAMPLI